MTLPEKIMDAYPELTWSDFGPDKDIDFQNDGDGFGDYIVKWTYSEPIPDGLVLGKPGQ